MMTDPVSGLIESEQFRRYLSFTATAADEAELRQLGARLGIGQTELEILRLSVMKGTLWRRIASRTTLDADLVWQSSAERLTHTNASAPPRQPDTASVQPAASWKWLPSRSPARRWMMAAALAVLSAGAALVWKYVNERPASVHVVGALAGQRIEYRLPDGSRVVLAPESQLRFRSWKVDGPRELELEGEAYFEVVHDASRPFRVRAADMSVEDLGTEFVIRAYPHGAARYVAVRSGEVAVRGAAAEADAAVLGPGQAARIDASGVAEKVELDTASVFAWLEGQLVFRKAPLAEIVRELRRWYGVDVRIGDHALMSTEITFAIPRHNTTAEAVAYVADLAGARIERRGTTFVLVKPEKSEDSNGAR